MIVVSFIFPQDFLPCFTVGLVLILVGVPAVYSYLIFKKMEPPSQHNEED